MVSDAGPRLVFICCLILKSHNFDVPSSSLTLTAPNAGEDRNAHMAHVTHFLIVMVVQMRYLSLVSQLKLQIMKNYGTKNKAEY